MLYVPVCTLFTTTLHSLHFPSGPISLATPASLSSVLALLLHAMNIHMTHNNTSVTYNVYTCYIQCLYKYIQSTSVLHR